MTGQQFEFDLRARREAPHKNDRERRYREWLASDAGRKVFPLFERFALQMLDRRRRFGFRLIAERVRWEVKTTWEYEDFKLNDHYTPFIARDMIAKYPALGEYVETRDQEGDDHGRS